MRITLRRVVVFTALSFYAFFILKILRTPPSIKAWVSKKDFKINSIDVSDIGYKAYVVDVKKNKWDVSAETNVKNRILNVGYKTNVKNNILDVGYKTNVKNNILDVGYKTNVKNNILDVGYKTNVKKEVLLKVYEALKRKYIDVFKKDVKNYDAVYESTVKSNKFDVSSEVNIKNNILDLLEAVDFNSEVDNNAKRDELVLGYKTNTHKYKLDAGKYRKIKNKSKVVNKKRKKYDALNLAYEKSIQNNILDVSHGSNVKNENLLNNNEANGKNKELVVGAGVRAPGTARPSLLMPLSFEKSIKDNDFVIGYKTNVKNNLLDVSYEVNTKINKINFDNKLNMSNTKSHVSKEKEIANNGSNNYHDRNNIKNRLDGYKTMFENNISNVGYETISKIKSNYFNKVNAENNNVNNSFKTNKENNGVIFDKSQTKTINNTESSRPDWTNMIKVHQKIYNKFTENEIQDYYEQEKITNKLFGKTLDTSTDFNTLKKLFPNPIEHRDRVVGQLLLKLKTNVTKVILAYNNGGVISDAQLKKCNVDKCIVKTDVNELSSADVVFFDYPDSLHKMKKIKKDQVWILYQLESALNSPFQLPGNLVNWTATYRQDSVINTPYERFTPYLNVSKFPKTPLRNYALSKTKTVAWFVSNCDNKNGRSIFAEKLNKYIKVDIYGACGTLKCERSDRGCFQKLKREYKFYLSFENSNCKDYVTEKLFWNAYENDVVPIVMGAHPEEYKRIAPPHSYIHVDDFFSVEDLAEYLNFLNQNDLYYNQYFLWKNTGSFIDTKFTCRLCAMAHLAPLFPMWYSDLNSWWKKEICQNPKSPSWRNMNESVSYAQYIEYGYQRY